MNNYQSDGKEIGFWIAGHTVYGTCVFVANFVLLLNFNNFSIYGEILVALMIFAYFFFLGLESYSGMFPVVSHIFQTMFSMFTVWASMVLSTAAVSAGELAFRAYSKVIKS